MVFCELAVILFARMFYLCYGGIEARIQDISSLIFYNLMASEHIGTDIRNARFTNSSKGPTSVNITIARQTSSNNIVNYNFLDAFVIVFSFETISVNISALQTHTSRPKKAN